MFEVLGDAVGFFDDGCGVSWGQDLVGGLGKEAEPAVKVAGFEGEFEVGHQGLAFVAACGEEDGRPEVLEQSEVGGQSSIFSLKIGPISGSCRTLA